MECPEKRYISGWKPVSVNIMESPVMENPVQPQHILDLWAIVLVILATIVVMTSLLLCPAVSVIIYRIRTNPSRNEIE
nr:PREDICTED: small integral membrane protein 3 [Lepisosteus oculatus]